MLKDIDKEFKKILKGIFYTKIVTAISFILIILIILFAKNIWQQIIAFTIIFILIIFSLYKIENQNEYKLIIEIVKILKKHKINTIQNLERLIEFNKQRIKKINFITIASFFISIFSFIKQDENINTIILIIEIICISYIIIRSYEEFSNQTYINKLNDLLFYLCVHYDEYFLEENSSEKKNSIIKDVLLYAINKIFK